MPVHGVVPPLKIIGLWARNATTRGAAVRLIAVPESPLTIYFERHYLCRRIHGLATRGWVRVLKNDVCRWLGLEEGIVGASIAGRKMVCD